MSFNNRYVASVSMTGNSNPVRGGSAPVELDTGTGANEANVSDVVSVGVGGGVTMTKDTGAGKTGIVSIGEGGSVVDGVDDGVLLLASAFCTHIPFKPWPVSCVGSTL